MDLQNSKSKNKVSGTDKSNAGIDGDDFVFRPMTEGLGFHKRASSVDVERDVEDHFTFGPITDLGGAIPQTTATAAAGVSRAAAFAAQELGLNDSLTAKDAEPMFEMKAASPPLRSDSRRQVNTPVSATSQMLGDGMASTSSSANADLTSRAKPRHNSKSVSELIAALPPAMDFLDERERAGTPAISQPGKAAIAASHNSQVSQPVPTAATVGTSGPQAKAPKKSWLNLPLGRSEYNPPQPVIATPSIDENLAKAFPHLSRMSRNSGPSGATANAAPHAATANLGFGIETPAPSMAQVKAAASDEVGQERALAMHAGATILDGMVVMGVTCIMLAIVLGITGANLIALLENSTTNLTTGGVMLGLFVVSYLLYVLVARTFFSATLGEWSYEVRVGKSHQRRRWSYPIQVLWRGVIAMATGIVALPILSALVGRDLFYFLTGLEMVALTGTDSDQ